MYILYMEHVSCACHVVVHVHVKVNRYCPCTHTSRCVHVYTATLNILRMYCNRVRLLMSRARGCETSDSRTLLALAPAQAPAGHAAGAARRLCDLRDWRAGMGRSPCRATTSQQPSIADDRHPQESAPRLSAVRAELNWTELIRSTSERRPDLTYPLHV